MKNENLIIGIGELVFVVLLFGGFGGMMNFGGNSYGFGGMMNMMYGTYGSGMMFFGWFYGLLILVALVLFIVWLVKQLQNK